MSAPAVDVVALGSAIVDVLATADEAELDRRGLVKGTMALVDEDRAHELYGDMGPAVEVSGGSAANTMAGVASFGGSAAFIGKVRDDQLGEVFTHDIRAVGVAYDTPPATTGPATARCLVFVTADAQRTMTTYLGAATGLQPDDVDPGLVAGSRYTYLEGYLWDPPEAIAALRRAIDVATESGRQVAFSLSDPFCVARHRAEFLELIDEHVDVLFANEVEITSLFEVGTVAEAVAAVRRHRRCSVAAITLGPKGSMVVTADEVVEVPAAPVEHVVDTTGAGDLYAAGFLHGLVTGADLAACAGLGGVAAAEVISHLGARPQVPLHTLVPST
ncbi:MAG TPA: adenosine kinase [Acidimicrobiales bacterium]|nr:adenosine kinase [Acidimicrobiales bacterium]